MIFGTTRYGVPSRFLRDLPKTSVRPMATDTARQMGVGERRVDRLPSFDRLRDAWTHPQARSGGHAGPDDGGPRSRIEERRYDAPASSRAREEPSHAPGERYVERDPGVDESGHGPLRPGARVSHEKFGTGKLVSVDGGDDPTASVQFPGWGVKRIKLRFLRL